MGLFKHILIYYRNIEFSNLHYKRSIISAVGGVGAVADVTTMMSSKRAEFDSDQWNGLLTVSSIVTALEKRWRENKYEVNDDPRTSKKIRDFGRIHLKSLWNERMLGQLHSIIDFSHNFNNFNLQYQTTISISSNQFINAKYQFQFIIML